MSRTASRLECEKLSFEDSLQFATGIRGRIPKDCPSVTTLPETGRLARHKASHNALLLYQLGMAFKAIRNGF